MDKKLHSKNVKSENVKSENVKSEKMNVKLNKSVAGQNSEGQSKKVKCKDNNITFYSTNLYNKYLSNINLEITNTNYLIILLQILLFLIYSAF